MLNRLQTVRSYRGDAEDRTRAAEAADSVLAYVRDYDPLTFAEVLLSLPPAFRATGECELALQGRPNVVLWSGLSLAAADLLCTLFNEQQMWLQICTPALYRSALRDSPRMTAVASVPVDPQRECWLPCTIGTAGMVGLNSEWSICVRERLPRS
ncbi:MAG TPA: hypothetical protein VHB77_20725 [Planctomycetaceae bacterium]|nr:hypothetical protein [Planctomycetaceae bacterium]